MPNYTLNRNYLLSTTNGTISFEKGEPTWVPPHMEADAVAIGAEIVEGQAPDPLANEGRPQLPNPTVDERKAQCLVAFEMLAERNDPKDFTGAGVPTVKAVEKIVEFSLERGEIAEYWQEFKTQKG